jgi:hypothetical protein
MPHFTSATAVSFFLKNFGHRKVCLVRLGAGFNCILLRSWGVWWEHSIPPKSFHSCEASILVGVCAACVFFVGLHELSPKLPSY